ncbi:hypothetical protein L6452_36834 [Arctium lappa]|uniref:Uncharacterized protein n=1 Tax=Arctium lappa TaxID=4217 RepID=A0ACB8Y0J4_ARCLA|nr:hypothetical protein L6452_36834 [Arctium lappa]
MHRANHFRSVDVPAAGIQARPVQPPRQPTPPRPNNPPQSKFAASSSSFAATDATESWQQALFQTLSRLELHLVAIDYRLDCLEAAQREDRATIHAQDATAATHADRPTSSTAAHRPASPADVGTASAVDTPRHQDPAPSA